MERELQEKSGKNKREINLDFTILTQTKRSNNKKHETREISQYAAHINLFVLKIKCKNDK